MALYQDLGSRGPVFGISDLNLHVNPYLPGTGWDVQVSANDYATNLTGLEIYHIAIDGPIGSSMIVLRDGHIWDYVSQGWANGWDPQQPLPIPQANPVTFCWNFPFTAPPYNRTTNIQPQVTLWLRQPLN